MIEVNNLHYAYPKSKKKAINGLDFAVEKGEIFGFLGPSGAGKSTTQKIIIGILKGYQGQVKVFNQEMKDYHADYYEKIGVSFEFPNLYLKFSALENLTFFQSLYDGPTENPHALLEMVGLQEDGKVLVQDFSKGMRMRLNFCRALLNKPKILFLDEPTSGLDPVNAKKVKNIILEKKNQGTTIFLTTHNMNVADEICDRVAFIVDGKLNLIDSPRNLKIQKGEEIVRVEYQENQQVLKQDFSLNNLGENSVFLTLLKTKKIETIHTQEATLEDIFIQSTGRSL
ncbi:MAG: ABC transporter ATP-binding protein [Spirochaetes bacterium]|nr:ABC transporter ATP-binding protein [Spirochaetota bacterium]